MASHLDFDDFGPLGLEEPASHEPTDVGGPCRDVDEGWPEAFERRDHERGRVDAPIELLIDGHSLSAELENDHLQGAFIRADHELRPGQTLSLRQGSRTREMEVVHVRAVPRSLTGMCLAGAGLRQLSSQGSSDSPLGAKDSGDDHEISLSEQVESADRTVDRAPTPRASAPVFDRELPPRASAPALDRGLPPRTDRSQDRPLSQGGSLATGLRGYRR